MAFDVVPWAIGGGATLDEGIGRMLPHFMFQGQEGVLSATDLEVKALATPGGSIRVSPGGFVILGRYSGQLYEAYLGRNKSDHVVSVDTNNTASSRSDLVIARIPDPYVPGSPFPAPPSPSVGVFAEPYIIKGVPSTTRNLQQIGNSWSAIPLARIDIPAFTSTITQAYIVSLRTKVGPPPPPATPPPVIIIIDQDSPENPEYQFNKVVSGPVTPDTFTSSQVNVWRTWPTFTGSSFNVPIPRWATHMDAIYTFYNAQYDNAIWGETRLEIGNGELYSPTVMYDFNYHGGPGPERDQIVAGGGTISIPSSIRGKVKRFRMNARSLGVPASHTGTLSVYRGTLLRLEVQFKEQCS